MIPELLEVDDEGSFQRMISKRGDDQLFSDFDMLVNLKKEVDDYYSTTNDPRALRVGKKILWKLDAIELEIEQRKKVSHSCKTEDT